ncbi:hypothetical protein A0U91_16700 (plasmid) [Acetobacter persici]|uniref:Uncharacterized protein n=1 Tax=Acetobacter persici TaxID=1076596 RepID=A0A1U9LJK0_9PROT|nr:hypothetical protein A0U91_16700 [Acetobacter persici]
MIKIRIHEATNLVISKLIHALSQRLIYMPPWNPVPLPSLPHDSVNLCFRDLRWLFGKLAEVSYIDLITVEKHRKEKPDRIKQFQKDSMEGVDYWGSTPPPS